MEITQKVVSEIVKNFGLKPDKDLGQNFLIDTGISEKIASSINATSEDDLLEIGGGLGSITHYLIGSSKTFDVVDIDDRMCKFLSDTFSCQNVTIINNDVRKIDVSNYTKIIGNLPYYITTELITFLVVNAKKCSKMVFMIQNEAVERFVAQSGKDYGPISVLINLLGKPKKLFNVKAGAFYPMPKCGSTVFEINFENKIDRNKAINVYKMTKQLFLNRRKTLLNNLTNYTKNKGVSLDTIQKLGLFDTIRPEQVDPKTYVKIYDEIQKASL